MDLPALADFNLVARHGGFGRAARATGRPKATLSRRVRDLEASLQLRLLERGTGALKLTQEGRALYERTTVLLSELDETAAAIASGAESPRGLLRVSAPLLFCQVAMGKLAAEFAVKHPDVQLQVTTDDRTVNLVEEGYDLVIRVNPPADEALIGRIVLRDRVVVVAAPSVQRPVRDQLVPAVVREFGDPQTTWRVKTKGESFELSVHPMLSLASMIMVRDAVRAGGGVGRLPISLVGQDLATGRMVSWGDADTPETAIWALYPSRRLLSARVSAFLTHLREAFPTGAPEELAAYVAWGEAASRGPTSARRARSRGR